MSWGWRSKVNRDGTFDSSLLTISADDNRGVPRSLSHRVLSFCEKDFSQKEWILNSHYLPVHPWLALTVTDVIWMKEADAVLVV